MADLAIPFPGINRTKFRLVIGGRHPEILRLFRDIEHKVLGAVAAWVQTAVGERTREEKSHQLALFDPEPPAASDRYAEDHARGLAQAEVQVRALLGERGTMLYQDLWPAILAEHHVREAEVSATVNCLRVAGRIEVPGFGSRKRTIKDGHILRWVPE